MEGQQRTEAVMVIARIMKVLSRDDGRVRKTIVRVHRDGKNVDYTRQITELVLLVDNENSFENT